MSLRALHTNGIKLYDSTNQEVMLNAACIHYGGQQQITLSDIQKIKSLGFTAVRIFLYWGLLQPTNATSVNTAYFTTAGSNPAYASVDSMVNWCAQNGMYIILSPVWTQSYAPPLWARNLSGSTGQTTGDGGYTINLLGNAQIQAGVNYFYNWMATHYASNNAVIFESFNELLDNSGGGGAPFANFNNGWITAIEQGEGANSHIKIVEYLWNMDWQYQFTAPYVAGTHNNWVLCSHDYDPMDSWNPSDPYAGISYVQQRSAQRAAAAHAVNRPWIDTEFSKTLTQTQYASWYTTVLSGFRDNGAVGWTFYVYCSDANFATSGSEKWNVNNAAVAAVIMPMLDPYMVPLPNGGAVTHHLTTSVSPSAGGTITPPSGDYLENAVVTVTATPKSGYKFSRWSIDGA